MAQERFLQAISSLGNIEERVRRSLSLVGLIQMGFAPTAAPVVVVDDATRPGCNVLRNRRFGVTIDEALAAGNNPRSWGIKATGPIIIERILLHCSEAALPPVNPFATVSIEIQAAAVADPFVMATANTGSFVETLVTASDRPPVTTGAANGLVAGEQIARMNLKHDDPMFVLEAGIHLNTGDKLFVQGNAGAASAVGFFVPTTFLGRTF